MRWSNAGHPPPLLISPGIGAHCLETDPDLLLGIDAGTARHDHEAVLEPGDTVLLCTDGLIERRGVDLLIGLDWLASTASDLAHLPLQELSDALLTPVGDRFEDDVALLLMRTQPVDASQPGILPGDPPK